MKEKTAVLMLLCCLLVTGCTVRTYYVPNSLNVPMLRDQGQGAVSISLAENSVDFDAAYSPRSNLGLVIDASDLSAGEGNRGFLVEGGAGYYRPVAKRFVWDTYGLLGFGAIHNQSSTALSNPDVIKTGFARYGLQPSFGFRSKYVDLSAASRLVRVSYFNITGSSLDAIQYLRDQGSQLLFEPVGTVRAGYDPIKLQVQIGHSFNWTNKNFRMEKDIVSVGLVYTFGVK